MKSSRCWFRSTAEVAIRSTTRMPTSTPRQVTLGFAPFCSMSVVMVSWDPGPNSWGGLVTGRSMEGV